MKARVAQYSLADSLGKESKVIAAVDFTQAMDLYMLNHDEALIRGVDEDFNIDYGGSGGELCDSYGFVDEYND